MNKKYYCVTRIVTTVHSDTCYVKAENEDEACDLADEEFYTVRDPNADIAYDVREFPESEGKKWHDVLERDDDEDAEDENEM